MMKGLTSSQEESSFSWNSVFDGIFPQPFPTCSSDQLAPGKKTLFIFNFWVYFLFQPDQELYFQNQTLSSQILQIDISCHLDFHWLQVNGEQLRKETRGA